MAVGAMLLASLLYVDDIIDVTNLLEDRQKAHDKTMLFGKRKKVFFSGTKCYSMSINVDSDGLPALKINEEHSVTESDEIVYLGDVFNEKGNNDGLIKDRIRRGTKAMVTIMSLMAENEVGHHQISVLLLLYHSLFLSTMLFNSQTWSKLRQDDLNKLQVLQLRYLKRVIGVASSTPNCLVFLELGVLPITAEIHKRQLMYLYRILQLEQTDPVHHMLINMMVYSEAGEKNWWVQVKQLLLQYNIELPMVKSLSKGAYQKMVNTKVSEWWLEELNKEYTTHKKCGKWEYSSFQPKEYFKVLYPSQSRTLFMARSKTLDIKTHRTYKFHDTVCRGCGVEEETLEHLVNCGISPSEHIIVNMEDICDSKVKAVIFVERVQSFMEKVLSADGEVV